MQDADALLQLAEEGVAVAQGLGLVGGEVAGGGEGLDGDGGLGGADAAVPAVLELEELDRELDVSDPAGPFLQIRLDVFASH